MPNSSKAPSAEHAIRKKPFSLNDQVAIIASITALILSLYGFVRDTFLDQHVLRASVVDLKLDERSTSASILLVKPGKNFETLFSAQFIYSYDLSVDQRVTSRKTVGPVVVKPGEALVLELQDEKADISSLFNFGAVNHQGLARYKSESCCVL